MIAKAIWLLILLWLLVMPVFAQSTKVKVNIVEVAEYQQRSIVGYAVSDKKSKVIENKHGIHAMFHRETDMERRERMARRVAR